MTAMLGTMSAIGGGFGRDILATRTPMVLHKDIYAVAALLGGQIVAFGGALGLSDAARRRGRRCRLPAEVFLNTALADESDRVGSPGTPPRLPIDTVMTARFEMISGAASDPEAALLGEGMRLLRAVGEV